MFRPSFSGPTEFSGTRELGGAGLSAGVETQLTGSQADIGRAHQFFTPPSGAEAHALSVSHMAAPIATGAEAAMLPMVPGASEPVSPLIQLIMRLPGQIGLMNSFFEALGNFIFGNIHALGLDTALLDIQAHVASAMSGLHMPGAEHLLSADHLSIDSHLLPSDAPILHGQLAGQLGMHGLPGSAHLGHSEMLNPRDSLKVGADLDLNNPKFEGASGHGLTRPGELFSGPNLSDAPVGNHLASTQRIFSDRFQGSFFQKPGGMNTLAGGGPTPAQGAASGSSAMSNAMNVGANNFAAQPQALPAVAQAQDGLTGGGLAQANGIDTAGGGQVDANQLLASNAGADSFRPSTGTSATDAGSSYLQQPSTPSDTGAAHTAPSAHPLKALRAKELSLDGVKSGADKLPSAATHPAQNVAHQAAKTAANAAAKPAATSTAHTTAKLTDAAKPADAGASEHGKLLAKHPHVDAPKPAKSAVSEITKPVKAASSDVVRPTKIASTDGIKPTAKPSDAAGDPVPSITSDLKPTSYTIRAGDCLWNIAKDHLGSGMKWQEIYKLNHDMIGSNPDLIHTGGSIKLPGMSNDLAHAGTEATKYVVKPGDCLWNIAKDQMHDATKWGQIFHANESVIGSNPRVILPGEELTIPGTGGADMVADASGSAAGAVPGQQLAEATSGASSQMAPAADASGNFGAPAMGDGAAMQSQAIPQPGATAQTIQAQPISPTQNVDPGSSLQQVIPTMHYNTPALGPGAAGSTPLRMGPGAAGAATLHTAPLHSDAAYAPIPTDAATAAAAAKPQPIVTSSFGADLASFLSQRK